MSVDGGSARAGYEQAIAVLRGVHERTGSPAARWAADYLAADPDRLRPPITVDAVFGYELGVEEGRRIAANKLHVLPGSDVWRLMVESPADRSVQDGHEPEIDQPAIEGYAALDEDWGMASRRGQRESELRARADDA